MCYKEVKDPFHGKLWGQSQVPIIVDENIIANIKMQNIFCYPLKMVIAIANVVVLNLFASIFV